MRRDEFNTLLFGLTDESVEFRNRWRGLASVAVWLILSGLSMIIMLLGSGAKGQLNIAVIIGMSFVKYVPLLMVVYSLARVMAARYLDDVYELDDEDLASDFLEEVTFGYGREKITINEGTISEKDEQSPLILIGGPGSDSGQSRQHCIARNSEWGTGGHLPAQRPVETWQVRAHPRDRQV